MRAQSSVFAATASPKPWFGLLVTEWGLANVGHYAVLSVLSLYLLQSLHLSPSRAGFLALLFSLSFRLSRILLVPLVQRTSPRVAAAGGLLVSSAGHCGLALVDSPIQVAALFLLVGLGVGSNTLTVKILGASADSAGSNTRLRYATLGTSLCVAGALGPLLASAWFQPAKPGVVFFVAAAAYATAALLALGLPAEAPHPPEVNRQVGNSSQLGARRALTLTAIAFFLYAPFYSTLPLFAREVLGAPNLIGVFFTLNAVIIILGQIPFTQLASHRGWTCMETIAAGYVLFAAAQLLLWGLPTWPFALAAIALWTAGEILLWPNLDALIAETVPASSRAAAFGLAGIAVGIGDGIGNLASVSLAGWLLESNRLPQLYGIFGLVALLAAVATAISVAQITLRK